MIPYRPRADTDRIILHASHTPVTQARIEHFLKVTGRERGLLEIGYHFVIDVDGKLLGTRPHHTQGSHAPGFNRTSLGVCLAGGLDAEGQPADTFGEAQRETLRFLVGYLRGIYGPLKVLAHTECGRAKLRLTQCPPLDINQLRKELECTTPCP